LETLLALATPIRDLRFDNVPSGWSGSSTERFSGWDIIPTQVPKLTRKVLHTDSRLVQESNNPRQIVFPVGLVFLLYKG